MQIARADLRTGASKSRAMASFKGWRIATLAGLFCGLACAASMKTKGGDKEDTAIHECPAEDCGPALGMPRSKCEGSDVLAGPTGRCIRQGDGVCGWEVIECPPAALSAAAAGENDGTGGAEVDASAPSEAE